jgi:hypothetical protein
MDRLLSTVNELAVQVRGSDRKPGWQSSEVGRKEVFPAYRDPLWKMERINTLFEDWLPVPLTVAT